MAAKATGFHTTWLALLLALLSAPGAVFGAIRDGNIDPANLGKGDWIYSMKDATNRLGGHVAAVTNEASLMQYYRSAGVRYMVVKAATGDALFNGCYSAPQFTSNLVRTAHNNGMLIFGYNRSTGSNILGEVAISDYVFRQGADGFVWDAEIEWETLTSNPWITNGAAQAWALCSAVRSNWPTKFLAHAPFAIIGVHSTFPYKEFGYWCDAVMPQVYHFSAAMRSSSAAINWTDVNWRKWQNDVSALAPSTINGQTVYWTNAVKPILPMQDVYGATSIALCEGTAPAHLDRDVLEFLDYLQADRHAATAGGYQGASFWRTDLHSPGQWAYIKAATIGDFADAVSKIVLDDSAATVTGGWAPLKTYGATLSSVTYYGTNGVDTNSFGTNYWVKGRGTGAAYMEFTLPVSESGDYNVYQWHPYRADASASVPFIITHASGTTTVLANQQTNDGQWSYLGRFPFVTGTGGKVRVTDGIAEANALAMVDGVKLVFVAPSSSSTNWPTAPGGLTATAAGAFNALIGWTVPSTNATGYVLERSRSAPGPYTNVAMFGTNVQSYNDSGLLPGTAYYYTLRATNAAGSSPSAGPAGMVTATNSGQFTAITVRTDSRVRLSGTGEPATYTVEASSNLVQWTDAGKAFTTNGTISYLGEAATNAPQKFFRLRAEP